MTGKHHLMTGASTYLVMAAIPAVPSIYTGPFCEQMGIVCSLYSSLYMVPCGIKEGLLAGVLGCVLSVLLFFLGVLLPDIDSQGSILGKIIYIPIRHRTWTHTIWVVFLFLGLSFLWPGFFWIAAGVVCHLIIDSVSNQGVCWFYPISKYRYYPGGAAVKKKHVLKFYRTGSKMESVVCGIYVVLGILIFFAVALYSWYTLGAFDLGLFE